MSDFAKDYVDVAARIAEFYKRYPDGSLQMDPIEWVEVESAKFIMGRAYAYRSPDDVRPGIGTAWEAVPGRTPYTRGSEVQNLETSAWGRAIAALGIATRDGIATAQDVQAAREREGKPFDSKPRNGAWRHEPVTDKGLTVLVDRKATLFLIGTEMDYEVKSMSAGFTFRNPNEKGRCGCGESFHV